MNQSDTISLSEQNTKSAFFVLKVWEEKFGDRRVEWRGEMLHVNSDTAHIFEEWPELVELIADALGNLVTCVDGV